MCDITLTLFFNLNQQFITWGIRADCGSYFITIYRIDKTTWYIRQKKKEREKKSKEDEKRKGIVWREKLIRTSKE